MIGDYGAFAGPKARDTWAPRLENGCPSPQDAAGGGNGAKGDKLGKVAPGRLWVEWTGARGTARLGD